ncbi:unnamed protein product, partial [Effrenium voratum]
VTKELLFKAAETSWSCLPSKYTARDFDHPFLAEDIGNFQAYKDAKMSKPLLGRRPWKSTCRDSLWPRTCSYWVSMHSLAARADDLSLGEDLLDAVVPIIAGGATFCGGCTRHFRALMKPVLSPPVEAGLSRVF